MRTTQVWSNGFEIHDEIPKKLLAGSVTPKQFVFMAAMCAFEKNLNIFP